MLGGLALVLGLTLPVAALWQRLLGRPVSECGGLCHGAGGHEGAGGAGGR
jgi:hypothetical protein